LKNDGMDITESDDSDVATASAIYISLTKKQQIKKEENADRRLLFNK